MQRARFPMKHLYVTQRYGRDTLTHKHGYAVDIAGKDASIDRAYAPFDCKVVHRYAPSNWSLGHTVWFQSLKKVEFADGTVDYATISMTHDNDVSDLPHGKKFKQGDKIYDEGTAGRATGNHIHLEVARGKFKGTGWQLIGNEWVINNPYKPEKMLLLHEVTVRNKGGLDWKKEVNVRKATKWEVRNAYRAILGREPSSAEEKQRTGKPYEDVVHELITYVMRKKATYQMHKRKAASKAKALKPGLYEVK